MEESAQKKNRTVVNETYKTIITVPEVWPNGYVRVGSSSTGFFPTFD